MKEIKPTEDRHVIELSKQEIQDIMDALMCTYSEYIKEGFKTYTTRISKMWSELYTIKNQLPE